VFAESDMNQDGEIDLEEFHIRSSKSSNNADRNKDGFLSLEEFNQLRIRKASKRRTRTATGRSRCHEFGASAISSSRRPTPITTASCRSTR